MGSLPIFPHRVATAIFATLTLLALRADRPAPRSSDSRGASSCTSRRFPTPAFTPTSWSRSRCTKCSPTAAAASSSRHFRPASTSSSRTRPACSRRFSCCSATPPTTRSSSSSQLTEEAATDLTDFWNVRSQIPGDVLREITAPFGVDSGHPGTGSEPPELANLVIGTGAEMRLRPPRRGLGALRRS